MKKTHCVRGHERTPDNVDERGSCKKCRKVRELEHRKDAGWRAERLARERKRHQRKTEATRKAVAAGPLLCNKGHRLTLETVDTRGCCRVCTRLARKARATKPPVHSKCRRGHDLTKPYSRTKAGQCRACKRLHQEKRKVPRTPTVVCGRKFCSQCKRWRLLVYFRPRKRNGLEVMSSWCETCTLRRAHHYYERAKRDRRWVDARREAARFNWDRKARAEGKPIRTKRSNVRVLGPQRGAGFVDVAPFLEWLDGWLARNPDVSEALLAEWAGSAGRSVRSWRNGVFNRMRFAVVDGFLVAAGEEYRLHELYPLEEVAA